MDEPITVEDALRAALRAVVADVLEYERANNLSPNPGRKYCWDSVARAQAILHADDRNEAGNNPGGR